MKLYHRDTPLHGFAPDILHYHAWSEGRVQRHCYHYELEDEERIAKAKSMGAAEMPTGWCTEVMKI